MLRPAPGCRHLDVAGESRPAQPSRTDRVHPRRERERETLTDSESEGHAGGTGDVAFRVVDAIRRAERSALIPCSQQVRPARWRLERSSRADGGLVTVAGVSTTNSVDTEALTNK